MSLLRLHKLNESLNSKQLVLQLISEAGEPDLNASIKKYYKIISDLEKQRREYEDAIAKSVAVAEKLEKQIKEQMQAMKLCEVKSGKVIARLLKKQQRLTPSYKELWGKALESVNAKLRVVLEEMQRQQLELKKIDAEKNPEMELKVTTESIGSWLSSMFKSFSASLKRMFFGIRELEAEVSNLESLPIE